MKPENVPQQWRNLIIGAIHEALDDNMLALHYADIERMVDEGLAAVAPLIAAVERERCAQVAHQHGYDLTNLDERNGAFSAAAAIRALP